MDELTPTQEASRELAESVFGNPGRREKFEAMADDTVATDPRPDDFAWLSRHVLDRDARASRG